MKITILGAGAVGSLWAVQFKQQGHDVQLWTRHHQDKQNLKFQPLDDTLPTQSHVFPCNSPEHLASSELLLVTVKAFQVETALKSVFEALSPQCAVVIMHNGMGSQQFVADLLPKNPILYGCTSQGVMKTSQQELKHTGIGPTWLGAHNVAAKPLSYLADIFNQALAPCQWHEEIAQALWQKLAVNCAINPLTAFYQCTNGELIQPNFQPKLNAICKEVTAVMIAEGYKVQEHKLRTQVDSVIHATATNYSSMNRDIFYRRQTEIDYITHYVISRAKHHGIAVPANTELWQAIKTLESSYA